MRRASIAALLVASAIIISPLVSFAESDDTEWVAKCMLDNKDEGQSTEIVKKYCECMNDKMGDNESKSVTEWEKSHPKEEKECSKKSGWK